MTHYAEALVLNALFRATAFTPPTTIYMSLWTVTPDDSGSGTEVSGSAYVREAVTFSAPATQSPSGSQIANSANVLFPAATGSWGTIVGFALHDAASGGNMLFKDLLTNPLTVTTGMQPQFSSSSLTLLVD